MITTPPAHGTVTYLGVPTASGTAPDGAHAIAAANGSVMATYTPAFDFNGTDTFAFTAGNINGTSAPATVSIAVARAIVPTAVPTPALSAWAWLTLMGELRPRRGVVLHCAASPGAGRAIDPAWCGSE